MVGYSVINESLCKKNLFECFQYKGIVIVEFRNDDTARSAFIAAKKIERPHDAEGYERPPLIATFHRLDDPRRSGIDRKRPKEVQQIDCDSDSGGETRF